MGDYERKRDVRRATDCAASVSKTMTAALVSAVALVAPVDVNGGGKSAGAVAAELTARQVTSRLFQADPDKGVAFVDMDLSFLDLSKLDFKAANLTGADLYGSDLTDAILVGANLSEVRLDRATIVRTDFAEADLTDATLLRPNMFGDLAYQAGDVARFGGAKLVRARLMGHFPGGDFRGANMEQADLSPLRHKPDTIATVARVHLERADFTGTNLRRANLEQAVMSFTTFAGADLAGANLRLADLTRANFSNANLANADFTGAKLDGVILNGANGIEAAKGLSIAGNRGKNSP